MKQLLLVVLVILIVPSIALSARPDRDPQPAPLINAASVDFSAIPYQVQIFGESLIGLNDSTFNITFGGMLIETYSLLSEKQINFEIPAAIAGPGTYRMTLENLGGQVDYELAIGTIGPIGTKGDPGPAGVQGPPGEEGHNSLIASTDELAGVNCASGGVRFQAGTDFNRNNLLDAVEVNQTQYVCNGTASGEQPAELIKVTASPSTQAVNSFVNVTAVTNPPTSNNLYFSAEGTCKFFDSANSTLTSSLSVWSMGGIASVAMTNTNSTGGPCTVYAGYSDYTMNTPVVGSALATFVPELPGSTDPSPAPMTVTATPSTQSVNSFVNVTAIITTTSYSNVGFFTLGSCKLYDFTTGSLVDSLQTSTAAGLASVAATNTNATGGPCIVYAYSYDSATQNTLVGTALATFVP